MPWTRSQSCTVTLLRADPLVAHTKMRPGTASSVVTTHPLMSAATPACAGATHDGPRARRNRPPRAGRRRAGSRGSSAWLPPRVPGTAPRACTGPWTAGARKVAQRGPGREGSARLRPDGDGQHEVEVRSGEPDPGPGTAARALLEGTGDAELPGISHRCSEAAAAVAGATVA